MRSSIILQRDKLTGCLATMGKSNLHLTGQNGLLACVVEMLHAEIGMY